VFQERTYREWVKASGLVGSHVCQAESDLFILAEEDVTRPAADLLAEVRQDLEDYIQRDEEFLNSRVPYSTREDAPLIARRMAEAARRYDVGPMAAVAGAVAECVGEQLARQQVVVENGGDIFIGGSVSPIYTLYAGEDSPFTGKLRFIAKANEKRMGVCTSSGTVGHSFSQGRADAVCVMSTDAARADAAATAYCNQVRSAGDIGRILDLAGSDRQILGMLIVKDEHLGARGCIEFC
jgi:uncharacterized protein